MNVWLSRLNAPFISSKWERCVTLALPPKCVWNGLRICFFCKRDFSAWAWGITGDMAAPWAVWALNMTGSPWHASLHFVIQCLRNVILQQGNWLSFALLNLSSKLGKIIAALRFAWVKKNPSLLGLKMLLPFHPHKCHFHPLTTFWGLPLHTCPPTSLMKLSTCLLPLPTLVSTVSP